MITRILLAALFLLPIAARAEDAPTTERVKPYAFRIVVEYDDETYDMIRDAIRRDIRLAQDEMQRRRLLSEELLRAQIAEELARLNREIEKLRHARRMELDAIERQDAADAERWRQLRLLQCC